MNVKLSDLKPGARGRISRIDAGSPVVRRLMDMGVTVGTPVKVERIAPLGDPIEITVRGYHLTLRRSEACLIEVAPDEPPADAPRGGQAG